MTYGTIRMSHVCLESDDAFVCPMCFDSQMTHLSVPCVCVCMCERECVGVCVCVCVCVCVSCVLTYSYG